MEPKGSAGQSAKANEYFNLMQRSTESESCMVTAIYHLYSQPTLRFIRDRYPLLDDDTAQDVLSEVLLRVWEHRGNLQAVRNVPSYLRIVAKNVVVDRHRRSTNEDIGLPADGGVPSAVQLPIVVMEHAQRTCEIASAIDSLAESHRLVLTMDQRGLSAMEIASHFGCSENAVRRRLQKARKHLRSALSYCGDHCAIENQRAEKCPAQKKVYCFKWLYIYDLRIK
jgi:RNA polymerase sigma-70 factor (ECF subfamily)